LGRSRDRRARRRFGVATAALSFSLLFTFLAFPGGPGYRTVSVASPVAASKCTVGLLGLVCVNLPPLPCTGVAGVTVCPTLPTPSLPPLLPTPTPTLPPAPTPTLGCVAACAASGPGAPPGGGTTNQGTGAPATAPGTSTPQQQRQVTSGSPTSNPLPVALTATTDPLRVPLQTESLSPPPLLGTDPAPLLWALLVIIDAALATVVFIVARATRLHKPPSIAAP
jgi:hypothetical protein